MVYRVGVIFYILKIGLQVSNKCLFILLCNFASAALHYAVQIYIYLPIIFLGVLWASTLRGGQRQTAKKDEAHLLRFPSFWENSWTIDTLLSDNGEYFILYLCLYVLFLHSCCKSWGLSNKLERFTFSCTRNSLELHSLVESEAIIVCSLLRWILDISCCSTFCSNLQRLPSAFFGRQLSS